MDRDKIINAMEAKALEIFNNSEKYQSWGKRGVLVAQVKSATHSDRWETTVQSFGATCTPPEVHDGKVVYNGMNFDAVAHGKIAYTRRTGKNSGVANNEIADYESYWHGAVISDDGNCICAFSGLEGDDDVAIAEAGIAVYNQG